MVQSDPVSKYKEEPVDDPVSISSLALLILDLMLVILPPRSSILIDLPMTVFPLPP